jgi:two-component system nitrate/nitrite sensor histidine kinase NarX
VTVPARPDRPAGQGSPDLHRLKWIGVALPIVFLVAIEAFRYLFVEEDQLQRAEHVAIAVVTGIAVVIFASLMFYLIERAQRQVIRQNRELAAVNAVSTAVQGELGVDQIIDAALHSVVETTGATEASVTVFPPNGGNEGGIERRVSVARHASAAPLGPVPHLVDIPLTAGTAVLGRMRLHLPEGASEPDLLASATLQNIGHQLACSIQIGQLVADLQRRKAEGHGIYDVLMRISNQDPLAETLGAVVRHAHDLIHSDEAVMCVNAATATAVGLDGPGVGARLLADGSVCLPFDPDRFPVSGSPYPTCPVRATSAAAVGLEVTLTSPDGTLGDLWIGRLGGPDYGGRELGYLSTLGGLASIAITNARMRESEQQAAILAERERIAREMHDSLAQVLGVTHLRLRALRSRSELADAPGTVSELVELADLTEEAYRDVREAILGLRESSRADRGLVEGLRAYLDKYSHQSGVRATLATDFDAEPALWPRAEVQVIRVIQEALANVRKHSGASSAVVRISNGDDWVTFAIEDDGRGFDLGGTLLDRDSGFGLHTMRERMELIGGTLAIDSAPGRGTRVIARVPGVPHPATTPEVIAAP